MKVEFAVLYTSILWLKVIHGNVQNFVESFYFVKYYNPKKRFFIFHVFLMVTWASVGEYLLCFLCKSVLSVGNIPIAEHAKGAEKFMGGKHH